MSEYFDEWEREPLNERATRALIEKYREEYDKLTERFTGERLRELEAQIVTLQTKIVTIKGQNPNGTLVPALEQTANALVKENDELVKQNRQLAAKLKMTERQLSDIQKAVRGKVPA